MDEFFFSLKIPLRKDGILPIQTEHACFCQPMSWSMAAMLRDSTVAVVVVVRTRPRAIPLAMIHMRKSIHGFPFVPLYGYGAPLGGLRPPSSAITPPMTERSIHQTDDLFIFTLNRYYQSLTPTSYFSTLIGSEKFTTHPNISVQLRLPSIWFLIGNDPMCNITPRTKGSHISLDLR